MYFVEFLDECEGQFKHKLHACLMNMFSGILTFMKYVNFLFIT